MPENLDFAGESGEVREAGGDNGGLAHSHINEQAALTGKSASVTTILTTNPPSSEQYHTKRNLPFLSPLRVTNFRWYLSGQAISRLGDQFYLTALPWLVLTITPNPIALALVVGLSALANAGFTLWGGVLADRYGPRALVLGSDIARFLA